MTTTTAPPVAPTLLERVRAGNDRFNEQLRRACAAAGDPARWARITDELDRNRPKLEVLCWQLMAEGYHDCLYPAGEHQCDDASWFCWVCPKE